MLRYDSASIVGAEEPTVSSLSDDREAFGRMLRAPVRSVCVESVGKSKTPPTEDRWRSFGWTVSDVRFVRL
jgi:hypothetical protein